MQNIMGSMKVNKLVVSMSLPIIISMLIQALYNIVDSMFVAQINEEALTALSIVFPLQNLMIAFAAGGGVGMNALLSRSLGAKDEKQANSVANHGFVIAVVTSFIFMVICVFLTPYYFALQDVSDTVKVYGQEYTFIIGLFCSTIFVQICMERLLQSTGRTKLSMYTQGVGAIINIIMDPILIFGYFGFPALGVQGAAIATVIGQLSACLLALYLNRKYNKEIHLSLRKFTLNFSLIRNIYRIALPSIIMGSIGSVMTFSMNQILLAFSQTATAFFGVYIKLQSFVLMPTFGLNNGLVPLISFNYGAGNKQRVIEVIKTGVKYGVGILWFGFLLIMIFPGELLQIFNASDTLLEIGVPGLRIISTHFLIAGFSIILTTVFQSLGYSYYSMIISICRQLVVLIPCAYILSLTNNINMVWLSYPIAEIVSLALSIFYFQRVNRNVIQKMMD